MNVARKLEKMGVRTSPMAEVFFENCEVPEENLLGKEGGGAFLFTRSMTWERGCILASAVGIDATVAGDAASVMRTSANKAASRSASSS